MQIQNSLYRLVLLKLHPRVQDAGETCSREFDSKEVELHEASSAAISGMNVKDSPDPAIVKSADAEEGLDLSFNDPTKKPNIKSLDGNDKNVGKRGADVMITASNNGNLKDISGISPKAPKLESLEGPLSSFNREGKKGLSDTSGFSSLDVTGAPLNDTPEALLGNRKGGPTDASKTLLKELAQPLQALIRCTQIQRSLFHKLIQVNAITSNDGTASSDLYSEGLVNMVSVQSKLEDIAFKKKMECSYARNPYTNHQLRQATSEDVVQHISRNKNSLNMVTNGGDAHNVRELPHGRGKLKTVTGEVVYNGEWCKGQRHGKGECLILSLHGINNAVLEHGFYTGGWKNNMRHGSGKMMFSSGAVYEGQWQFDRMTGYGTLKLPDGTIQQGTRKEGSLQGCAVFTWPDGITEYREFDGSGKAQSSCRTIEKEVADNLLQKNVVRRQLLDLRECVTELRDEKLRLTEELNAQKVIYDELVNKVYTSMFEIRESFREQQERNDQKLIEELNKASDEVKTMQRELEEAKGGATMPDMF
ncbi:unnamed protein product [Porites evermanni]|uniref:Uncharacterized protein n=1 Tax=Porites evermanni TaxID=104178 RepID=A0ABN8MAX5_9CNID|nr:unnamed protein product [Porites evermanni]